MASLRGLVRRVRGTPPPDDRLDRIVETESYCWGDDVADVYHNLATAHIDRDWTTLIVPFLAGHGISFDRSVDFACGYGRNTVKLLEAGARQVTMVDLHPDNIAHCERQFAGEPRVTVVRNNGRDLRPLADATHSFVYSFDSMVHFDVELIAGYMPEFFRVLEPGGFAFLHHSNYDAAPGRFFGDNPHSRNFMTQGLFLHLAIRAGFEVVKSTVFQWAEVPDLDAFTILKKPV